MKIYILINENNKCFIGKILKNAEDISNPLVVYFPLLFMYNKNIALNSTSVEFQSFDAYTIPNKIRTKVVTIYEASKELSQLYIEECAKIFKKEFSK